MLADKKKKQSGNPRFGPQSSSKKRPNQSLKLLMKTIYAK